MAPKSRLSLGDLDDLPEPLAAVKHRPKREASQAPQPKGKRQNRVNKHKSSDLEVPPPEPIDAPAEEMAQVLVPKVQEPVLSHVAEPLSSVETLKTETGDAAILSDATLATKSSQTQAVSTTQKSLSHLTTGTLSKSVSDMSLGGHTLGSTKLPGGYAVKFNLPCPRRWSPGEPIRDPVFISFRKLLNEQHPGALEGNSESAVHESNNGIAASMPSHETGKPNLPSESTLAGIGRCDHLAQAIRSMENRLAKQGLLAAPTTILGKKESRGDSGDGENFYDAHDAFIDDADLENINAQDKQQHMDLRRPGTHAKLDGGTERNGPPEGAEAAAMMATTDSLPSLNLAKFRQTGPEVSGTSEEEGEDGYGLEGLETGLESRHWREQLAGLASDLVLVPLGKRCSSSDGMMQIAKQQKGDESCSQAEEPELCQGPNYEAVSSSATAQKPQEHTYEADVAMLRLGASVVAASQEQGSSSKGVEEIQSTLSIFCEAVEECAVIKEQKVVKDKLCGALQALWDRLPPLLRLPSTATGQRRVRWKLHQLEQGLPPASASCSEDDAFPMLEAEEVAWTRFCWRLVRSAAPEVTRSNFFRCFLEAVRDPQRQALVEAIAFARKELNAACTPGVRLALADVARNWQITEEKAIRGARMAACRPLSTTVQSLQRCWLRQRFWEEQRQSQRLTVPLGKINAQTVQSFSIFLAKHIRDFLGIPLPVDMLQALARSMSSEKQKSKGHKLSGTLISSAKKKQHAGKTSQFLPLDLPRELILPVGTVRKTCTLLSVASLDKQKVLARNGDVAIQFTSLEEAARAMIRSVEDEQLSKAPMVLLKSLRQEGGWRAFQFRIKSKVMPLAWALKTASKSKIPAFRNPANCDPCPILTFGSAPSTTTLSSSQASKAKVADRMRFLGHLEQGMWISCKCVNHVKGVPGALYNCKVANIHLGGSAGMQRWQRHVSHVDVFRVHDEREDLVPVARVHPPYIWAVNEIASVHASGLWRQCKIIAVRQHEDVSQLRFEVEVGESRLWVGFCDLQPGSLQPCSTAASGGAASHSATSASHRQKTERSAMSSNSTRQILTGTQVKYLDKGRWIRAKVSRDTGGDRIEVVMANPMTKRDVYLELQRERVVLFKQQGSLTYQKHAHAKRDGRKIQGNGVIPVEDSD